MYLALNSASSEESFALPFLPTLVISRYIAASIAIGIAAVSIVDKVSVNTPFSKTDFLTMRTSTEAVAMKQPPSDKGKRLKIYYMTQVSVKPPTFVMFVNDVELTFSYTRYIENRIRESFGFRGTSIRFINRERKEKE